MESFIVRIYRRNDAVRQNIIGIVEKTGTYRKKNFHTSNELIDFLNESGGLYEGGTYYEKRDIDRLKIRLPVKVKGNTPSGQEFFEETESQDLSAMGISLTMENSIEENSVLDLVINPGNFSLSKSGKVVRVFDGTQNMKTIGILFK